MKHQTVEPTPVSELRPSVTPALQDIIRRMMAKRPDDRFRTPALAATALASFCKE
jgi:hypothetical protein